MKTVNDGSYEDRNIGEEAEQFEIERKFLIGYPDVRWLEDCSECTKSEITQTYLNAPDGDEARVRQRVTDGNYEYFHTVKRKVSGIKRVEIEHSITEDEYLRLLTDADTTKRQIRKDRYCLTYEGQCFEIDVYPFWNDRAIMEIELRDEDVQINMPPQISVIKEVTDDEAYKNSSLAKMID